MLVDECSEPSQVQANGKEEVNHSSAATVSQPFGRLPRVGFLVGHRSTGANGISVTGLNDGFAVVGAADRNSAVGVGAADGGNVEEED